MRVFVVLTMIGTVVMASLDDDTSNPPFAHGAIGHYPKAPFFDTSGVFTTFSILVFSQLLNVGGWG